MIHQSLYHMPLKLMICSMNCSSVEMTQDDLFPSGWALGQGTDPYGLPFLTVSLAVVAAITMLQQLSTLKKSNLQIQIIHFWSIYHQQVPHGSLESRSIYHEGFHIFQVANKFQLNNSIKYFLLHIFQVANKYQSNGSIK